MPLQVVVVSAEQRVWAGEAAFLTARTVDGEMGILPGHTPVLAVLAAGEVKITPTSGSPVVAELDDGFLSVEHDRVTVVSDSARLTATAAH